MLPVWLVPSHLQEMLEVEGEEIVKTLLAVVATFSFSGCVVMSRRNYNLALYENRLIGRMEGISLVSTLRRPMTRKDVEVPVLGRDEMEDLINESIKETDKHFWEEEERLGIRK